MPNQNQNYFDHQKFLNSLMEEIKRDISPTPEEEAKIKELILERLNDYLLSALFDCLGTAEVRMLNAMRQEFPDIPMPLLLLYLSQYFPHLQKNVEEYTSYLKKEILYLSKKVTELDKKIQN